MYSIFPAPQTDDGWRRSQAGHWIEDNGWTGLLELLIAYSTEQYPTKYDAELIAPHEFKDGYRGKANALTSSWLFLDIDDGDLERDTGAVIGMGIEALFYASPSHSWALGHRYRIVVPVLGSFASELYWNAATGLNYALGEIADTSKLGRDSWCFVPGRYACGDWFEPIHLQGRILPVTDWVACSPHPEMGDSVIGEPIDWKDFTAQHTSGPLFAKVSCLRDCLIKEKIEKYERIGSGQGKTQGLFGLMLSAVQRAIYNGYYPSEQEIAELARYVDRTTDNYHQRTYPRNLQTYAITSAPNIIAAAQKNVLKTQEGKNK